MFIPSYQRDKKLVSSCRQAVGMYSEYDASIYGKLFRLPRWMLIVDASCAWLYFFFGEYCVSR
jgi:hypothetical protein